MLAFWLRQTYPHAVEGAIVASGPLRVFSGWQTPDWDSHSYWATVTRGANATGGSAAWCSHNIRAAFDAMIARGATSTGRASLERTFRLCPQTSALHSRDDVERLYKLMLFTFDTLSMGNYPYPSNYLTGGRAVLPAFPLRRACDALGADFSGNTNALLEALSTATRIVTNASSAATCVTLPTADADDGQDCVLCDYFACTNANPLETEFSRDGLVDRGGDMFLPHGDPSSVVLGGVNVTAIESRCARLYGTRPRWRRMSDVHGGSDAVRRTTNVVYSNGFLDQWSSAGITWVGEGRNDSISLMIHDAAHHLDLMFTHPHDPPSVTQARQTEREYIARWVASWRRAHGELVSNPPPSASSVPNSAETASAETASGGCAKPPDAVAPQISISWTAGLTGRLFLIVSRDLSAEPRFSVGSSFTNAGQIFSVWVNASMGTASFPAAGQASFPYASLEEMPAGPVYMQAVLTPYEQYNRSDGHSLWLPGFRAFTYSEDYDSYGWANVSVPFGGAKGLSAEGALFSKPVVKKLPLVHNGLADTGTIALTLTETVPAFPAPPAETAMQKYVTLVSPRLSHFWGRPVNVSAWVTLPAGFDKHPSARYPLIINHGHYSYQRLRGWSDEPPPTVTHPKSKTGNPDDCYYCSSGGGCCEDCDFSSTFQQLYAYYFTQNWTSLDASSAFYRSRVLLARIQSPNPFFDDSYAVNSDNLGPWGDAITFELVPEIERRFRGLGPWARGTYGGSTGGWEALAVQVKYPEEYNGCIACAPDPIDFRALLPLNIYSGANAFRKRGLQLKESVTGSARTYTGDMLASLEDDYRLEQVLGGATSGGQIGVWMAVYGPRGADGMPRPVWNASGHIDREVAEHWREEYDLSHIIERDWKTLASSLRGKMHVWVGTMDAYYLDAAVYLTENRVATLDPPADADFRYGTSRGRGYSHAWKGDSSVSAEVGDLTMHQRLIPLLVEGFLKRAPAGADVTSWRY